MIARGQRNVREVTAGAIDRPSTPSNAIAPHAVVEHNVPVIRALTTGTGAIPEAIAEEEAAASQEEEEAAASEEVAVAGADGGG
jgi:hypothetical protein